MLLKTASLTPQMLQVIQNKGTEQPFTGTYADWEEEGSYLCRQCGLSLFRSHSKFHSGCGWPSFDEELPQSVLRKPDADGMRTEILCARCQAHLGHVFKGEGFTNKDTRHCVNSISLDFVSNLEVKDTEEAIFAAGCFWGVEYYFQKLPGVLKTEVGYTGGHTQKPSYREVCRGDTGHVEALRVIYDPAILSYEKLAQFFFEVHDFTQANGQGPDLGEQYHSVIFYYDQKQEETAKHLLDLLKQKDYKPATRLAPVQPFWRAEEDHQAYYQKKGQLPYCHRYEKRF